MKIGLAPEHINQLEAGESVEFDVADVVKTGHNTTISIEPADRDAQPWYDNLTYLPTISDTEAWDEIESERSQ